MPNVRVMTDNVACIPRELAEEHRIAIVPTAHIVFDGHTYTEGVSITAMEAYDLIKKDADRFETSALAPGLLVDELRKVGAETDQILLITLSSRLSAFFNTGNLAAEEFRKQSPDTSVRVFDSKTVAGSQGLIALAAARAAARGAGLDDLVDFTERVRQKTRGLMLLDTLKYIYRTGRMTKDEAREAAKLKIKPLNRMMDDGTIEPADIVRKRSDGYSKIVEIVKTEAETDALHFIVSHAAAPQYADALARRLEREFNPLSMVISDYSPVMGYGAGPGALFVGFQPQVDFPG